MSAQSPTRARWQTMISRIAGRSFADLRTYCAQDTRAMVDLLRRTEGEGGEWTVNDLEVSELFGHKLLHSVGIAQ